VSTPDGTLVLTGYNTGTGQVSYTYDPNVPAPYGQRPDH